MLAPQLIAHIPKENRLNIYHIEGRKLSVWFPLLKRYGDIALEEFNHYALISEEQFKEYEKNKTNLQNIVLAHKDSKLIKDKNKDNLSATNNIGLIVDKSKATISYPLKETPFVKGSRLNPKKC